MARRLQKKRDNLDDEYTILTIDQTRQVLSTLIYAWFPEGKHLSLPATVSGIVVVNDRNSLATLLDDLYGALSVPFDPDSGGSIAAAGGTTHPRSSVPPSRTRSSATNNQQSWI